MKKAISEGYHVDGLIHSLAAFALATQAGCLGDLYGLRLGLEVNVVTKAVCLLAKGHLFL